MDDFVEFIRPDGTVEYRHPNYEELMAQEQAIGPHIEITAEEIAQANLDTLRYYRDKKLAETDWWANSDRTMTAEQIAYRQALRDITNTYNSLETVVWPTKP